MMLEYYLGKLGIEKSASEQASNLRKIILVKKQTDDLILHFKEFVLSQQELKSDTIQIINRSLMPQIGSEYLGLGGDNYLLKSKLYEQFVEKFPNAFGLVFYYADCSCNLAKNKTIEEIYPILREAMLADKENSYYPSTDLFDLIEESEFNFEFDILLLETKYQPCDKITFDEYIDELKEKYTTAEQQKTIENLIWKC